MSDTGTTTHTAEPTWRWRSDVFTLKDTPQATTPSSTVETVISKSKPQARTFPTSAPRFQKQY